ncbi:ABC transporter permease [Bosea sp. (in: a-proteobacteria)]|uniref:ABC transporter permease n=1 Tax=Bosea sp. (in: a-proteobacteria) TaxID=1871050 RepID=UPI002603A8B0|nr:ABC transporter permease [Bosea sp. (in: a-proteobacteria)]MCO5091654.1 ABC transporter permease [Bosea sp. (in: a-proteobacteria)]
MHKLALTRDSILSLLILFTLVFFMIRLAPGDPVRLLVGVSGSQEQVEEVRRQLGFDLPVWRQYFVYLSNVLHLDSGNSIVSGRPVVLEVADALPYTVSLVAISLLLALVFAVPAGFAAAIHRGTFVDALVTAGSVGIASIPAFWLALVLIDYLSVRLGLLPSSGASSWRHAILPAIVLATSQFGIIARLVRTSVVDELASDYIRTARAKGARPWRVMTIHVMRNAAVPVVTIVGLQFGLLLGGAVVTETIFNWPGLGRLMIRSLLLRDYPVIQFLVLTFGVGITILNLLIDLLVSVIDPRLKSGEGR